MPDRPHPPAATRALRHALSLLLPALLLTGCVANSSNPRVGVSDATMDNAGAQIHLVVTNPGGRDLTIEGLSYEISHGDLGFPLANDAWTGAVDLPAKGDAAVTLSVVFDTEPIEADSGWLHMNGLLMLKDHTGFLGLRSMDLSETSFQLEFEARRTTP